MSVNTTLYNGLSGVGRQSDNLSVLADNIANVATVGFKSSHVSFEEIIHSLSPQTSKGSGVALSKIEANFNTGSLTTTNVPTDMAIAGKGFFIVNDGMGSPDLYTRDGQFMIAQSEASPDTMYLTTPMGLLLQGYDIDVATGATATALSDITIDRICTPLATQNLTAVFNLEFDDVVEQTNVSLYDSWDGSRVDANGLPDPIDADSFTYSSPLYIYDDQGNRQELTIYFDNTSQNNEMEYLLTCNPAEDRRLINGGPARYNDGGTTANSGAGSLLYGVISFNSRGDFSDMAAYRVPADSNVDPSSATNLLQLGRGEPYYSFDFNFSGTGDNLSSTINFGTSPVPQTLTSSEPVLLSTPGEPTRYLSSTSTWSEVYDTSGRQPQAGDVLTFSGTDGEGNPVAFSYTINPASEVSDLLANLQEQFNSTAILDEGRLRLIDSEIGPSALAVTSITYRDSSGNDPSSNPSLAELFASQGDAFDVQQQNINQTGPIVTTAYASPSVTLTQQQDGYGFGYLTRLRVDNDGVVFGRYSNGQQVAQAAVALADFTNYGGLTRAGSNLYTATEQVGNISIGRPNEDSFGSIAGGNLEASNVDIGDQLTQLITTQRIYQANAKSISTADEIYQQLMRLGL